MRADETSWPYNNPGGDEPDWAAGDGHPSWPANGNGQDWTAGDDSWPANGNGQDWTAGDDSWPVNGNGNGQDWPYGEDHPSYPANGNGQDWTAGDDRWPANGNGPAWPYGEDHPSWPAGGNTQDWPRAGGGPDMSRREPAAALHHDPRVPTAPPPPGAPVARVRVPANGGQDGAQQRPGPRGAAGPAGAPYYEVAFGEGRVQVLVPSADQDFPSGVRPGTGEMPQLAVEDPAELLDPVRRDSGAFRDADSVRLAERILADADSQAADIKQQALDHANAIRAAAEQEAEDVRRQAAFQAEAIREAATREADELRAGAIRLSAELGQVAAYVTRTLT
ncbi:MAG: hypothetical protein ACHQCE_11815, partial [Streptosporangiales bacterium]